MKILVLGHGRHGKDTAAEYLRDIYGFSFRSSSMAACQKAVLPVLAPHYGYTSVLECYEDRGNHRQEWKELITAYNTPDKSRLAREILEEHDMYVGMRCDQEYSAARNLFDCILWIDAHARKPEDPTMAIKFDPQIMIQIDNNGEPRQMYDQLENLKLGRFA